MNKKVMIMSSSLDGRLITAAASARELGMKTVLCVREEDDTTIVEADSCYAVDSRDTKRLLEIAEEEKIDGILGMWDKTVLPAAMISKKLGLPGNDPESMLQFLDKIRFRKLQRSVGAFHPNFFEAASADRLEEKCKSLHFPIIIKPSVCSSSFGQTRLDDEKDILPAYEKAAAYSGNGLVCVEEYIGQDELRVFEADIVLVGDDILWDGLCWCYRFPEAPLRPVLATHPASLDKDREQEFKSTVKKILSASGAKLGEYNIEGFFTKEGRFFIIEINPRPAGYYNQQDMQLSSGIDYPRLLVTTAVGDMSYYEQLKNFQRKRRYILAYAVFSFSAGIFDHLYVAPSVRDCLITFREFPGGEPGSYIEDIHADNRPVGIAVLGFSSEEELEEARQNIRQLVHVVLR